MDIPVYLITGFLDAGKTDFINGILKDGFASEDRTLLLCCDVCVGLHNLSGPLPGAISAFADFGMWLFYLPSQLCVALSAAPERSE